MAIQHINIGAAPNDKTGTPARQAGQMINENFDYLDGKISSKNQVITYGTFALVGQVLTIHAGWVWVINGQQFTNPVDVAITYPYAATGMQRLDRIVFNTSNTFSRNAGPESVSNPIAIAPLPDTIEFGVNLVTDNSVGDPSSPVIGDNYVEKLESQDFVVAGSTLVIEQINLIDNRNSVSVTGSATDVKSVQLAAEFIRPGKPHFFKNRTNHDVKIWQNSGTGNIKYSLPNSNDFIVKPGEVIQFNLNSNLLKLEYVGSSSGTVDISGKEDKSNKTQDIEGNKTSTTFYASVKQLYDWAVAKFQAVLVSGTNIKTVNNVSLLGSENIETFNRGFAIVDDNFEDGVNSDLTLSAGWSVVSDGIAISSSGGWGNSALYNKYTAIDRISTRALVQVITTTSIFSLIRKPVSINDMGTVAQVDLTAMLLKFYGPWDGSTTPPAVVKSIAIPFSIVGNRKYLLELTKVEALTVFTFTDETNVNNTISLSYDMETETLAGIGKHWGRPGVMFNSGSIKLKRFSFSTKSPFSPKVLITGHSFVEGYSLIALGDAGASYSNLLYDSLIGNTAAAGRGGETITTLNTREDVSFFSPTYHLVDIGSNDSVYATWLAGIQTYIGKILATGAIPVLATIAPRPTIQSFANQCNDWIRLSGYNYIDFAKAVSLNNDGITQNPALFYSDAIHPNIAGHLQMFKQIKIDAPYFWNGFNKIDTGDIKEIIKTTSFSVTLAESGCVYIINSSSAIVVTYPTGLPPGKKWRLLRIGSGEVSYVAGSSATLSSPDNRLKMRAQYSQAEIFSRASNQGILGGDIVV